MTTAASEALLDHPNVPASVRHELDRLHDEVRQQQIRLDRWQQELREAAALQQSLIPSRLPPVSDARLRTWFRPADSVGGDLFDVFRVDDQRIAFYLIDATGHGVAAAMLAAFARRALSAAPGRLRMGVPRPDECLERLHNELLHLDLADCQFVAGLYGVYNEQSRVIRWARGGNPYPVLLRPGRAPRRIVSRGPLLGATPTADFQLVELQLQPEDVVVFHTDGLDDSSLVAPPAAWTYESLVSTVEAAANDPHPGDDLTAMVLRVEHRPAPLDSSDVTFHPAASAPRTLSRTDAAFLTSPGFQPARLLPSA